MSQTFDAAGFRSRSRLWGLSGIAIVALGIALAAGFVAQTWGRAHAPQGTSLQATRGTEQCTPPGTC